MSFFSFLHFNENVPMRFDRICFGFSLFYLSLLFPSDFLKRSLSLFSVSLLTILWFSEITEKITSSLSLSFRYIQFSMISLFSVIWFHYLS